MTRTIRLLKNARGATAIEYGLVAALISIAVVGAMTSVANETSGMWNHISGTMSNAIQ